MDLREQILRHRKDSRFILGGLVALLAVCTVVYTFLQRDLPQTQIANRLLLFALWYVNVLLILTVVFILVRSFFRLLLERHNRILGSKFKTKLVLTAIALSLIPVLILFPFATRLLVDSFEQWFSLPIEGVVEQAAETANALTQQIEDTNLRDAKRVIEATISFDLADLGQRSALQQRLDELRAELQLDYLAIYDGIEQIHGVADARVGFRRDPQFRGLDRFLEEAIAMGAAVRIEEAPSIDGRLILAARAAPRLRPAAEDETVGAIDLDDAVRDRAATATTVVVTGTVLPKDLAEKSENLLRTYQTYLQMTAEREAVRTLYLQALLMVTLLVVLAFSSIGLRLARRVTVPIQALADGTRHISSGDLDHRVEVAAIDDELGVLVDAFNHMTGELKRNRELVDQQNRQLRETGEKLAAVLQNVAAGVIAIDADGTVLTCNGAALEILNQREQEVIGRPIAEIWSDPERDKLRRFLEQDLSSTRETSAQIRLTVAGVWKTLEVKVTQLPDPGGEGRGRVVVLEELTELLHAQKMAAWTEVARRIAHEIKNPLTPIRLTAERLLRKHRQNDPDLGTKLEEGVEIIVREVSSMKNMVDEFSRFARMPQPHPQDIDLATMIDETLALYRGLKPGVEVESHIDPRAATARFDPDQLKSVLVNLLDNAVEATDPPGLVSVSTMPAGAQVLLNVADTGRGIRSEDKEKLFLPYFSTKGRGTGLGLSIVHRIVIDHDAVIRVEDNRPRGTIFTLELPVR